jgi:Na+/melibiose symporter-like transporter
MAAATSPNESSPTERRLSVREQALLSCFWLAYNVQWGALIGIVLPSQIAAMVGDRHKEFYNGLIPPIGALLSLALTPIAGALSDRSHSRFGRRRPFLLVGSLVNMACMLALAGFTRGSGIWLFLLAYLGVQFGANWAGGPYAGLIPDVVPPAQRGSASGWMALFAALGTLIGALSAGQLIREAQYGAIYGLIIVALAVMLTLTLVGVRETPNPAPRAPFELGAFLRTFLLDPRRYRNFYWVLGTRAFVTMGIYSVFTFFQFFLADVVKVARPEREASFLVGIIIATSIPTSYLSGMLSDRIGRKPLVYASGGLMALAAIIFIAVAHYPSLGFMFAVAGLFGLGYGAYTAVDWALAVDTLPHGEAHAKDMGIWHVAIVLPQVFAPALSGFTLNALKGTSLIAGYTVVFVATAFWFVLGTIFVNRIRGVR